MDIKFIPQQADKCRQLKERDLAFGQEFTNHYFLMDYQEGRGWFDPRIIPYGPMEMWPSAMCLHYGQAVFEGLKAYRQVNGDLALFRPEENFRRMNASHRRLCMPELDVDFILAALKKLLVIEKDWIPRQVGNSLYIRPISLAMDPYLGVRPAKEYRFMILLSPSGAYYKQGLAPVRIKVEDHYVRAVRGGMGQAKTAGNYAASLLGQEEAGQEGFDQVLWLDGVERKYIEEVGAMNIFFQVGDEIWTPALNGSILAGITRKSVLDLLRKDGYKVLEKPISIQEVQGAYRQGQLKEVFGTGTAAVISPVGLLSYQGEKMLINEGKTGDLSLGLYEKLTGIQWGKLADTYQWMEKFG